MRKGGVHNETKKLVDMSSYCDPLNCNKLHSTLDNEMSQYMGAHIHPDTQRKSQTPTYIILTIKRAYSNCLTLVLHKDWF